MHGRLKVKTSKEQEEELKLKEREKAYLFEQLSQKLFQLRPTIDTSEDHTKIFKVSSEILLINPDFYTAWNIRKEALLAHVSKNQTDNATIWKDELSFTIECLKKNEKSYSVWQHRIWILSKMPQSEYDNEIKLCNSFLAKDERNFHCWDYRSYISDIAKLSLKDEFDFTTDKIKKNFSNFSAWHRRHKLLIKGLNLPEGECPESCDLRLIWDDEYEMILKALFTDPSDQSPWLYHNWLVKNNFGKLNQEKLNELKVLEEFEPENDSLKHALELMTKYINK